MESQKQWRNNGRERRMIKCESIHVNAAIGNLRRNIKTSGIARNAIWRLKKSENGNMRSNGERVKNTKREWKNQSLY